MNEINEFAPFFKNYDHFGWTKLETPLNMAIYKSWIAQHMNADMGYLERHIPQKENPELLLPKAQSAFVIAKSYFPPKDENFPLKNLRVALYAKQDDYHFWLQDELNQTCHELKEKYPEHEFVAFTDSKPVLERDLAYRAGLGWVGKNTCLLNEKTGSLFFIGEIYTTLSIQAKLDPHADRCGTCTRCIDICPTGALEPRRLDANKCISYWTIESKKIAPVDLRNQFEGWYYGCDLCQTVCPWNQKIYKTEMKKELEKPPLTPELAKEILMILRATPAEIKDMFKTTPMLRAKPWAHKRNAITVAVHYKISSLKEEIAALKDEENLTDIVQWALEQL